jgi:hypothetical protein
MDKRNIIRIEVSPDVPGVIADVVEHFGLSRVFYAPSKRLRHERFAQLLFYSVADSYCRANNLDLSPESNSGRGPVDFKISRGNARVVVEVKWSSNSKLFRGFENQVRIYQTAESAYYAIYLIIQVRKSAGQIKQVEMSHGASARAGKRVPTFKVVDGRLRPSASKA